jgi:hypothetical protein
MFTHENVPSMSCVVIQHLVKVTDGRRSRQIILKLYYIAAKRQHVKFRMIFNNFLMFHLNKPNRMIEHHADKQNEQMMHTKKTIIEVSSHLSSRKCPDDYQAS